jgi:sec-independent protein translocase protein TatC
VGLLGTQAQQAPVQTALNKVQSNLQDDVARLSARPQGDRPVTLGIGEPFTTTVTVSLVFALIISLPFLLMQAYAFLVPALAPEQQRRVKPVTLAVPGLFVTGVAFGYFVVLPAAVRFFQNFNSDQFNVLVQASQYYKFAATTMLAMGLLFQVPVAIIAVTRAGIVTPRQLRRNRRYAVAACAALAAFLPGDAITMLLETLPLYLLFELGVLLADIADRRARKRALQPQAVAWEQ